SSEASGLASGLGAPDKAQRAVERAAAAAEPRDAARGFEAAAAAAGAAWFKIGPTGRIVSASALFEHWAGARAGRRPSLTALFPDLARVMEPGAPPPTGAWASRLIGSSDAPRAVALAIAGENGPDRFAIAAPLPDAAAALTSLDAAAPLALGEDGVDGRARLLDAFDGLSAERVASEAAIGVLVMSQQGLMLRLNGPADRLMTDRAADNARSVAGPVGDHLVDWIAEEGREQAEARLSAAAKGGAVAFEARLLAPGAAEGRLVQCFLSPVDTPSGRVIVCHMIDASEQRELDQSFVQSQKLQAVGQLAGGVAHDFNNLLTVIIGSADMQLKRMAAGDPAYDDLNAIRQAGRRAAGLVSQLLAFSRKQTLTPTVVNLTERCSDFVFLLARVIGERFSLVTDFEEGLWPVEVDVNQFEHVITNLVVNASHAQPEGGEIRLGTANARIDKPQTQGNFAMPPGDYVQVTVQDRGCGIPQEKIAKIFEPFFTTKAPGQGTGLGLAVVYGVVKQSGGYVFVDSAVGEGTRFTIYLPRAAAMSRGAGERLLRATEGGALKESGGGSPETPPRPLQIGATEIGVDAAGEGSAAVAKGGSTVDGDSQDALRSAAAMLLKKPLASPMDDGPTPSPAATPTTAPPPAATLAAPPPTAASSGAEVVLLLEDQAAVRAFAARSLADRGYRVIEAESGAQALDALRDANLAIDLMLSDVVLEDMDGPSVLREIGDARPEMAVIFMSGYAQDAFAETLETASAAARDARFLQKPFTLDELGEAVSTALNARQKR
ncbi:MAG: ATP-binding protein, partial [Pseudomonadota bacterium]